MKDSKKERSSSLPMSAAKGLANVFGLRTPSSNATPPVQQPNVASNGPGTEQPLPTDPLGEVTPRLDNIIAMIQKLDSNSEHKIAQILGALENGRSDLAATITALSEQFQNAVNGRIESKEAADQIQMNALKAQFSTEFNALGDIMKGLQETAVKQTEIAGLRSQLSELMSTVLGLATNNEEKEAISQLRVDLGNHRTLLQEAFDKCLLMYRSTHNDNKEAHRNINMHFEILAKKIEGLVVPRDQREHIQDFSKKLNELMEKITMLGNEQTGLSKNMTTLRNEMGTIQASLAAVQNNLEAGGLQFQEALACLASGLTAVLENRVMASIRENSQEVKDLRNSFEYELRGLKSGIEELRNHAVQSEDIKHLLRAIDGLQTNAGENNTSFALSSCGLKH